MYEPLIVLSKWFVKYVERVMYQVVFYLSSAENALYQVMEKNDVLNGNMEITATDVNRHVLTQIQRMSHSLISLLLL
jgi:hypothetical protein